MRPENRWNNKASSNKRKRGVKRKGPLNGGDQPTKRRDKAQPGKPAESSPATDGSSPPEEGTTPNHDNGDDSQDPPSKLRRANSMQPRRSSDTTQSRWQSQDPMEALRRAIQSSPIRNLEQRDTTASKNQTPKSIRRVLFPSPHAGLKALGETSGNSPRRSPRARGYLADKQSQDKENHAPSDDIDCLFESPSFDFDLPTSPTPRRRNARAGTTEKLSLPTQSPMSLRKDGSDLSPTKLTAQRLQRIQGCNTTPTRANKTPRRSESGPEPPQLQGTYDNTFEGIESIMADMFDNNSGADFFFDPSKYPLGGEWTGWFTSEAGSAVGSDEGRNNAGSEDFINAIFSDPNLQKENLQFDPFAVGDSNILDPGLFGSELNQDVMITGSKEKPSDSAAKEQQS